MREIKQYNVCWLIEFPCLIYSFEIVNVVSNISDISDSFYN